MTCNVGGIERPIRIVIGLGFLAMSIFADLPASWMAVALAIGTIALATGAIGFCPAWKLLGVNTCSTEKV